MIFDLTLIAWAENVRWEHDIWCDRHFCDWIRPIDGCRGDSHTRQSWIGAADKLRDGQAPAFEGDVGPQRAIRHVKALPEDVYTIDVAG